LRDVLEATTASISNPKATNTSANATPTSAISVSITIS